MWSCFKNLIIRKIITQSKFNLDARFNSHSLLSFRFWVHVGDVGTVCLQILYYSTDNMRGNSAINVHVAISNGSNCSPINPHARSSVGKQFASGMVAASIIVRCSFPSDTEYPLHYFTKPICARFQLFRLASFEE